MNRNPKGCSNFGGAEAAKMEYCRGAAMHLFSLYGYRPFSPAEFQLVEDVWSKLAPQRARRLIPVMSPHGEPCVLRGDITLSAVAYLASYHERSERPLRLSYADRVFSVPLAPKHNLEENQVGVELIGWEDTGADAETAALLLRTLDLLGIKDSALVLGDVSVLSAIFKTLPRDCAKRLIDALAERSYTKYKTMLADIETSHGGAKLLERLPSLKGGASVIDEAAELMEDPSVLTPLRRLCDTLCRLGYGERLRVDLSFVRDLGYYSGPIYDAYSTSDGVLLGGGGRYDGLLAKEGIEGEAAGFGLNLKELARHCVSGAGEPQTMLWGGGSECSDVLRYAGMMADRGVPFELSWTPDKEESAATAARRGYKWWVNLSCGRVRCIAGSQEIPIAEFESEVFSC